MSLFTGITTANGGNTKQYLTMDGSDTKTAGELNMNFFPLRGIAAPTEDFDAISKDYFIRHSASQSVFFKYTGMTSLNSKALPDYIHGNYRGSGALHTDFTDETRLYVHDISFDDDSTDYDMTWKFWARLTLVSSAVVDAGISDEVKLKDQDNFTVVFSPGRSGGVSNVRFINLGIKKGIKDLITGGVSVSDIKYVLIMAEQTSGNIGGQEFVIHCSLKEY